MADIFLSYAREDVAFARELQSCLAPWSWSIFWDRDIPVGQTWEAVLERELVQASCVVVLWSSSSVASEWVRAEASEAHSRQVLVPTLIEHVEVPLRFRILQAADLVGWSGDSTHREFVALVDAVRALMDLAPGTRVKPRTSLSVSERLLLRSIARSRRESRSFEGLIKDTAMSRSQVEYSLQVLIDSGLVENRPDSYGGRRCHLTDAGVSTLNEDASDPTPEPRRPR